MTVTVKVFMPWLIVIILSYFLFAVVSLVDRYLLMGLPNPKSYVFYIGVLGILVLLLTPFVNFSIPDYFEIIFCLITGIIYTFFLLGLFDGLERFEASRIIPAMGGFLPVFTFVLVYFFSGFKEPLTLKELLVFILLIFGSVLIAYNPEKKFSFRSLEISALTAFLLALSFILTKYVYLMLPFWTGFIWIRIGVFLTALFFLFTKEVRKEIFSGVSAFSKKTGAFFIFNQAIGAGAFVLQNWAIALAGLVYLSVINALQGIQYVFLFILALLFLKEGRDNKIIFQKIIAILFIGAGLIILTL